MTTTLVALLLSATALVVYEVQARRTAWLQDLQTQSDLMAQASVTAVNFDDARAARETLALLHLSPQIEAAAIYADDGRLFASYLAAGQTGPAPAMVEQRDRPVFEGQRAFLQQRMESNGEVIGTFVMQAQFDILPRLLGYLSILGLVMLASLALAALVATNLQRAITDPIVAVAGVAREVVQQRNYSLRATKTTDDEVGALVDAFNNMLDELGAQAQALHAADRRKDEFLATLAHELRNPLAPLSTALVLLARDDLDAGGRERIRQMMQRQLTQLVRLIDDLLEVSRISTGQLHLRMEKIDIVEAVRSAWESVGPAAQERRHRIDVQWPPTAIWVQGDRTRLAQVFVNLLSNAARYTEPGGRIELDFALHAGEVEVRVSDNGIGIDPSLQSAVFEMFVQVDKSLGRGRAGLGVGLSLARQLALLHGGRIELRSAGLGKGATFAVHLPRLEAQDAPFPTPDPGPAVRHTTGAVRVLVADDNSDYAESLADNLRVLGYEVTLAYDGLAALRAAREMLPDVGLFDIGMPGMNGYELAASVRTQQGGDKVLLVAITGWGQETDRLRAREAGFDHHFVKPVDMNTIADLLAARSAQAAGEQGEPPAARAR